RFEHFRVGGQGPDPDFIIFGSDEAQRIEPANIYQRGCREHMTLQAGDHVGAASHNTPTRLGEQLAGSVQRLWRGKIEFLHVRYLTVRGWVEKELSSGRSVPAHVGAGLGEHPALADDIPPIRLAAQRLNRR